MRKCLIAYGGYNMEKREKEILIEIAGLKSKIKCLKIELDVIRGRE